MTLLKRITLPKNLIYILFISLHLFLLNINVAEWGDSYRILRASEYIRNDFTYPVNEKRPPLYSLVLSLRPGFVDPILWGRVFMLIVSVIFLYTFEKFLRLFIKDEKYINIGLLLLAFNPVFLYWSIRIYADVFFSLLVFMSLYILLSKRDKKTELIPFKSSILLGIIVGLSILTRFEGYILFGSIGLSFLLKDISIKSIKGIWKTFLSNIKNIFGYVLSLIFVVSPWMLYRNPFVSTYFEEPTGRTYDVYMVWTYVVSLLFLFGFTSAFFFIFNNIKNLKQLLSKKVSISAFILLELVLILLWPAAIPRLFVPIIPFLVLFLSLSLKKYFEDKKNNLIVVSAFNLVLLGIYVVSQYFLKLQFLIPTKELFIVLVILQFFPILFIYKNSCKWFVYSILLSSLVWSLFIIYIHKDTFISVKNAVVYVSKNIEGVVAYNDVSSVSSWYLDNAPGRNKNLKGYFYNFEKDYLLTYASLMQQPLDYLLITNEHNITMDIDLNKRPYLTLIKEFSYNVNGKIFTSRIVKLSKEYKYE